MTRVRRTGLSPHPLPPARRSLAPDLARGVLLLVIALAHAHLFTVLIGGPRDDVVTAATVVLVDFRGYPMFAALFGYGLARIHSRLPGPWPDTRRLLRRRARWLIVFGLVHAVLLFPADILTVYGLVALILIGALRWRDRTLVLVAASWLPVAASVHALVAADDATTGAGLPRLPDGYAGELLFRLTLSPVIGVMMAVSTVVPFLIGILAARHRVLDEPGEHLRLLRVVAFAGIPVSVLGGLPLALDPAPAPAGAMVATALHQVSGYAGGLGYAAAIALVVARLTRRGPVVTALAALGQRSLTFYLAQSVAWVLLFSSYAVGWNLTSPAVAAVVAVAVWLATVLLADVMRRRGRRGPAEVALRRLTYGPARPPLA